MNWHRSGVLIVNFEYIMQKILCINPVFLFLTLSEPFAAGKIIKLISYQCVISITPENVKKPLVF